MAKKNNKQNPPSEQEVLQQRVDAIMDPKHPGNTVPAPPKTSEADKAPPPLDIFKGQSAAATTAPEVTGKLLKAIKPKDTPPASAKKPTEVKEEKQAVAVETNVESTTAEPEAAVDAANPQIDNAATDKAVDDIVAGEGDSLLAAEDAAKNNDRPIDNKSGWKAKLKRLITDKRFLAALAVLLILLFAVPTTRYKFLGLLVKKPISVTVIDSKTATPVSNAEVSLAGKTVKTDANGKTIVRASLGQTKLIVKKQYFKSHSSPFFIGFNSSQKPKIKLEATGRQVPITVVNKITGKALAGVEIKVLDTTAKTNKQGKAIIVLPTTSVSDSASLQIKNYNTAKVSVQVTDKQVTANNFQMTPIGQVYFLSNLSGKIDVVKTNLDGSGRQVILEGTGKEDASTTSLLAARDWRYVVLKARREGDRPALFLIDTKNDKVTQFDTSNANFDLVGWYGHSFIYHLISNTTQQSQGGHETIKSYDAEQLQLNQLDQSQVEGTATSYAYQGFYNFYILNNQLVYNTQWYSYDASGSGYDISAKNDSIRVVQPNGQGKKDYQSFPASGVAYIQATLYEPQAAYYAVYNNSTNKTSYYKLEDQTVSTTSDIDQGDFSKTYPTYLLSPSANRTFWTELRDGKNTLFTGDSKAQGSQQIITPGDYAPYGWYGDAYVLVSKNSSQLYIMPADGLKTGRQPLKVTDYFKPNKTYAGYGYGYGGL